MSNKKAITLTKGFVVDKNIMSEEEWKNLESGLSSRDINTAELATRLGMSEEDLENNLTHTETIILDC